MLRTTFFVLATCLVVSAHANLLENGDFESGNGTDADGWQENAIGNIGTVERTMDAPFGGSYAVVARVDWQSDTGTKGEVLQATPAGSVTPGTEYTLSFQAKGSLGPGVVGWYQILWLDADGSDGGGVQGATPLTALHGSLTGTYQPYGGTFTAPNGADSAQVSIRIEGGAFAGSVGDLTIDDVSLLGPTTNEPAPLITIVRGAAGEAIVNWAPADTQWKLEESTDLSSWTDTAAGSPPLTISTTGPARFYRLAKP